MDEAARRLYAAQAQRSLAMVGADTAVGAGWRYKVAFQPCLALMASYASHHQATGSAVNLFTRESGWSSVSAARSLSRLFPGCEPNEGL